jgi:8-oxo-dGTP pyrophosphatase MutT (NUDIX family)
MFQKNMEKYLEYFKDESTGQNENQWFFPKGRIHKNENQVDCAIREFEEETNINSKNIYVNKNISFEEYYIGSNNLIYKTVYYIAYIPYIPKKVYKYYPSNIRTKFISSERYDMEWLEFNDVIQKIDETKKDVLTKINNYILKKKKF